jgi:putative ABC transport system permease protein
MASALHLWIAPLRGIAGALWLMFAIVLVTTFLVVSLPTATDGVLTGDLQHRVSGTAPALRDVRTNVSMTGISAGSFAEQRPVLDGVRQSMSAVHDRLHEPLRSTLEPPHVSGRSSAMASSGPRENVAYQVTLEASDVARAASRVVDGRWPNSYRVERDRVVRQGTTLYGTAAATSAPIEIAISRDAARRAGWKVGESRLVALGTPAHPQAVRLVGITEPRHAGADFWRLDPTRTTGALENLGDAGFRFTLVAWMDTGSWQQLAATFANSSVNGWFGVNTAALDTGEAGRLDRQLNAFVAAPPAIEGVALRYSTRLDETLDAYLSSAPSVRTMFALLAAGPLTAVLLVLVLTGLLVAGRRRSAMLLLSSRGASSLLLRGVAAGEAAVVAVPAAVLGALAGALAFGVEQPGTVVLFAACCAAVPIAIGAGSVDLALVRRRPRARRRGRPLVEGVVVAVTIVAVLALLTGGLHAPADGIDPLRVFAPLLVCAAVGIGVTRVMPVLLASAGAVLRRARGAVALIGVRRAVGSTRSQLGTALAITVGAAISVLSLVFALTVQSALVDGAHSAVGADVSLSSDSLTADQVAQLRDVDGVRELASIDEAGYGALTTPNGADVEPVRVLTTDIARLRLAQHDLPPTTRVPATLTGSGRPIEIAAVGLSAQFTTNTGTLSGDRDTVVRVASRTASIGDLGNGTAWVLLSTGAAKADPAFARPHPIGVLVALDDGADADRVADAMRAIAGDGSVIETAAGRTNAAASTPIVQATRIGLAASATVAGLMCVLALVVMLVRGSAERAASIVLLRALGVTARQSAIVTAWEVVPVALCGLLAGVIAGILVPVFVLPALDLGSFTGGITHPPVVLDAGAVVVAAVAIAVLLAVSVSIALAVQRRGSAAVALRTEGKE